MISQREAQEIVNRLPLGDSLAYHAPQAVRVLAGTMENLGAPTQARVDAAAALLAAHVRLTGDNARSDRGDT